MESMKFVRDVVSSMIDIEFFLKEEELREKYEDNRIAEVIEEEPMKRLSKRLTILLRDASKL